MQRLLVLAFVLCASVSAAALDGTYFAGEGDEAYLSLLETSASMFHPNPALQDIAMLYTPEWNGFVEGPTWGAWWIQNSYGPAYCGMPFFEEPYLTFLQNAQALWFNLMGDGKRAGDRGFVAPDGCLCDAATPNMIYYRQGDGKVDMHDWGMEFTAAGIVLESELLLVQRDKQAIAHYLPLLERSADFIESRRDPANNLFWAGPAGNLLAPSYAGCKNADGSFGKAYLAGLSITYIAGLDRLIEVEKLAGNPEKAERYAQRRAQAREGLAKVTTPEGYFIKSLDPDGTRHGVFGAEKHGYFEAVPNHDAMAFRVVDDAQAKRIYDKIASIPGLRPYDLIITNYPGLDDMYTQPDEWLWKFGTWVNGGHWTTCEARMIMAYYRVGAYADAARAMRKICSYAEQFRMDNPLVDFGNAVYQPKQPINCVFDNWGAPAGMIRGLFEYLYAADKLTLLPHIPTGITRLEQRFPIRFGEKRLYLAVKGQGPVTAVSVNGKPWTQFDAQSVTLPFETLPAEACVSLGLGGAEPQAVKASVPAAAAYPAKGDAYWDFAALADRAHTQAPAGDLSRFARFLDGLKKQDLARTYAAGHAKLVLDYVAAVREREQRRAAGTLKELAEPAARQAADAAYVDTLRKLADGLMQTVEHFDASANPEEAKVFACWRETK